MQTNIGVALKPNFLSSLLKSGVAFSSITLKVLNLHNKSPKKFAFHIKV